MKPTVKLITGDEAKKILSNTPSKEMYTAFDIYTEHCKREGIEVQKTWGMITICSILYAVGKAQGIRQERERRKVKRD